MTRETEGGVSASSCLRCSAQSLQSAGRCNVCHFARWMDGRTDGRTDGWMDIIDREIDAGLKILFSIIGARVSLVDVNGDRVRAYVRASTFDRHTAHARTLFEFC